jgi:RNA polymerase sigma factor (TIGR02999 family)
MSAEITDTLSNEASDTAKAESKPRRQDPQPKESLDELFGDIYQELRGLAYAVRSNHIDATINPTALVNEVYLRMVDSPSLALLPKLHFKRIAGRAMREVLIDAARRRLTRKRGGDDRRYAVNIGEAAEQIPCDEQLLALHEALQDLARISLRQSAIVEHRFFGGMTEQDISLLLGISAATVQREWRVARAWLNRRLS